MNSKLASEVEHLRSGNMPVDSGTPSCAACLDEKSMDSPMLSRKLPGNSQTPRN
eukprot:CAMPEP_0171120458 /NCGR_PEP_ID=MMETSP0766_2-20121228/99762_1 /TAXON_ID=439317 /ORGANISM="Gambierdiscus australes, Strain CAWD 149" /LENGTH=53 /DNA_ID=CAMNT_0011583189 /DNA_START=192 /DNA_END=353 /DNA_ORIENTATION=-